MTSVSPARDDVYDNVDYGLCHSLWDLGSDTSRQCGRGCWVILHVGGRSGLWFLIVVGGRSGF